ncbi:uncharacterized protein LOC131679868 [Topomyia yanbarensis]|uniref:uncharacterized protein LOC131679868 n=1 Tax=Topomyia yanbarensis TaxID=2498891 RepID=UPI00273C397A|nr:uncharacterized protein LOC131679868 [Topomyia yanbarensis]
MNVADPWSSSSDFPNQIQQQQEGEAEYRRLQFEDDFEAVSIAEVDNGHNSRQPRDNRLPDSDNYLAVLERKLKRLKTSPTVLQQLVERREVCMQYLLNDTDRSSYCADLELNEPINNYELLRFIKPEQAQSVAERVNLIKYDHLEPERAEKDLDTGNKEGEESGTESSTSR